MLPSGLEREVKLKSYSEVKRRNGMAYDISEWEKSQHSHDAWKRLSRHPKPQHFTATDFHGAMAAYHDRASIALTTARPSLP